MKLIYHDKPYSWLQWPVKVKIYWDKVLKENLTPVSEGLVFSELEFHKFAGRK